MIATLKVQGNIETEDKDDGKVDDDMDDEAVEDEDKEEGEVYELEDLEALQQQNQNTPHKKKPGRKRKSDTPPTTSKKALKK